MTEEQQAMPLRDAVFMSLRKAILTGKIKPGERLTEVKLGKILGTSRTPIREAIRLLEQENLVTIIPGSGARVSRMTVSDLQDVMEVRSALEQLSAGLACERITQEEKAELYEAYNAFVRSTQSEDSIMIADADVRFHNLILKAAKNQKLGKILDGLADNIYRYRYEFIREDGHYEDLIREHKELYEAVISGNREVAEKSARSHIARQWSYIREHLQEDAGE
ncbi:MAG: GntR family transcriptional regulator [Lachnospiraceae bacterium]|nr:GntR family transcriptional regulator [Lachnospiraceae bacterium]